MSKRKPKVKVIRTVRIGKFRLVLERNVLLPRKIRSDKGTHKTKPESVSDPRD